MPPRDDVTTAVEDAQTYSPDQQAMINEVLAGTRDPADLNNLNDQPPAGGNSQESPTGQQGGDADDPTKETSNAPPDGEQAKEPTDEDLAGDLSWDRTPEDESKRLKAEHKASSTEARRLNAQLKQLRQVLKDQGRELVLEGENIVGLAATKDGAKNTPKAKIGYDGLTEDQKLLAQTDPAALVEAVVDMAHSHYSSRTTPTMEQQAEQPSGERVDAALEWVSKETYDGETKKHPDLKKNVKLIRDMVDAPNAPKALKRFFNENPEEAIELLNFKVQALREFRTSSARTQTRNEKKRAEDAAEQPDLGPAGGGAPEAGGGDKSAIDTLGKSIAGAGTRY